MQIERRLLSVLGVWVMIGSLATVGCGDSDRGSDQAGLKPGTDTESNQPAAAQRSGPVDLSNGDQGTASQRSWPQPPSDANEPPSGANDRSGGSVEGTQPAGVMPRLAQPGESSPRQLRADLPPDKLVEFLASVDADIQQIWAARGGGQGEQQRRDEVIRIVKLKLEASRRLALHQQADEAARRQGARGELQSLSHLASLGDLKSAEELETLAGQLLDGDDPLLAADSRLVLIGFAVESLQNGDADAAARIVDLVAGYPTEGGTGDIPALLSMGQAMRVLVQYEHVDSARQVRGTILDRFANSADPNVAKMTAQIAGNVQFDAIDSLLMSVIEGQQVTSDQWSKAVETLITESADLQTVQYLAGAAVEFESLGQDDLAAETYRSLAEHFDDPDSATGREVEVALAARQSRRQVIGRKFDPELPGVGDRAPVLADYQGKVVLMPFWATGFPNSLQLVPLLKSIRQAHPDKVAIVGMNLDPADAAVEQFIRSGELGFDSFQSESESQAEIPNPVAQQFGMVSMPFLVILDQQSRVAAIKLSDRGVEEAVESLINQ